METYFTVLLVSILLMSCCAAVENTNCTSDANCTTINSECDTSISRCRCGIRFYDSGTNCQPRGYNGEDCTDNVANSCLFTGQLVCKNDNKCSCPNTDTHYWDATSMTCKPKKPLGGDCSAAIECLVANSECATKCQCQVNIYDTDNADSGGTCEPFGGTSSEVSVGKELEANVTGLTPGVMYTITVISVDSNSRSAVQKTSPQPVNQATSMF
ncbi:unnamed protein product [Mytilus coruscus]|uniref:EGF-like domain-containing protein n=1 Tax=Mytilus coruscus TaxID=42192 RepID=A0A6J7ZWW3_MYTCO|nr:unnamed protein product [Mytilus coruscus]